MKTEASFLSAAPFAERSRPGLPWLFELVIIFSIVLLVGLTTPLGALLASSSPSPLWLPVLLLACQHGTTAGIVAALLSMVLHGSIVPAGTAAGEDMYEYVLRVWREPMLWLVAAVVLGGFRAQQVDKLDDLRDQLGEARDRLASIGHQAQVLRAHCDDLERFIACAADRSIDAGLAALENVRRSKPEALPENLATAFDALVGPGSYALLTWRDGKLLRDDQLTRLQDDTHALSALHALPDPLAATLARERRILSIRRPPDVDVLAGAALFAVPVLSSTRDRLVGVLAVQTLDPTRITFETERNLKVLARQLSVALGRERVVVNFPRERQAGTS